MPPLSINLVAAVLRPNDKPCIIRQVERRRLKVIAEAWCGIKYDAADGVTQLRVTTDFCAGCVDAIKAAP